MIKTLSLFCFSALAAAPVAAQEPAPSPAPEAVRPANATVAAPGTAPDAVPSGVPDTAAGTEVVVPGGTPVTVHVSSELSSSTMHEGDRFGFTALDDVRVKGWLVVAAGAQGIGEIATVEGAGNNAHAGKLGLKSDYVYAVDGEKVRLSQTNSAAEGEGAKGKASTATIASYVLLGPIGLFAHNFVHGHDARITPAQPFTMFVDDTVRVISTQRAANADNFAH